MTTEINPASQTSGYDVYLRVRDAVLRMKGNNASAAASPSAYWSEELDNIDYLIEASPLIIRKLRHHAFHITNVRPYDYRDKRDGRREHFEQRLAALKELGGDRLLVPESPALGGYGYEIDGRLYNIDTIKFYEVLIGMERGGIQAALRDIERPVVCEIGAGWGGFAYQYKTLFPRTRYVIVDFPELFLFSATYLGTTFPDARILFADPASDSPLEGWQDADFVFVPHTHARLVSALPLNLTVNMVSFQEMTDTQVRGYAAMSASAGCPLLYSLNRERSPFNTELVSVSEALADHYKLTEIAVLDTDYTGAFKKPPRLARPVDPNEPRYRHLVGRLDPAAAGGGASASTTTFPAARSSGSGPRVVLGMTLFNSAQHLPHAIESILAQTYGDFILFLLDDASSDRTEAVAAAYVAKDPRVRYVRHRERRAMIQTWHEVAETAAREVPGAEFFAWVSDHDWWHPRWLERLLTEMDADAGVVLAYPVTRRVSPDGDEVDKGPRLFETNAYADLRERWKHFCHESVGAGDMVYGLMRIDALKRAGIFRQALRPDRLLMAELTLQGRIRQVPEVLWYRRRSETASVDRQTATLMLPGTEPSWFSWPPWLQHTSILWREYASSNERSLGLSRLEWVGMLLRFQTTYGWRHFRKTGTSHAIGRGVNNAVWARKLARHHYHHTVYDVLMGMRALKGKARRAGRRAVYQVATLTHRLGLRGRKEHPGA